MTSARQSHEYCKTVGPRGIAKDKGFSGMDGSAYVICGMARLASTANNFLVAVRIIVSRDFLPKGWLGSRLPDRAVKFLGKVPGAQLLPQYAPYAA